MAILVTIGSVRICPVVTADETVLSGTPNVLQIQIHDEVITPVKRGRTTMTMAAEKELRHLGEHDHDAQKNTWLPSQVGETQYYPSFYPA